MPSPVRKFLGNRLIASLIVLSVPVLLATGMVSINWESGFPRLTVNREKVSEVRQDVVEKIQDRENGYAADQTGLRDIAMPFGPKEPRTGFGLPENRQPAQGFGERIAVRVDELKDSFNSVHDQPSNFLPSGANPRGTDGRSRESYLDIKPRFPDRR